MNGSDCTERQLLIQADLDGELTPAESAQLAAHVEHCVTCSTIWQELSAVSERVRATAPYHAAPASLRHAVVPARHLRRKLQLSGFALAACLALLLILPRGADVTETMVEGHLRALQPGHLLDVASTDQHTVKPWFEGRLDFAPPVKEVADAGFPLAGARLDYLAGRPVAALVYLRRQHLIDMFIWPGTGPSTPATSARHGYNTLHWSDNGMTLWAVSDLNADELTEFVRLWRAR